MIRCALGVVLAVAAPAGRAEAGCREPAASCPEGLAGPTCDIPCPGRCAVARQCHGDGDVAGLSLFGAPLFAVGPEWPDWLVRLALVRFAVERPRALGLADGLRPTDLELAPARPFEVRAGRLRLLRFRQRYRGIPVFAGDLAVIAGPGGATTIRGTVIDARDEYTYFDTYASAAVGEASILARAAERSRVPLSELRVEGLRLVAFRRARAIAWAGVVSRGAERVAHVAVAADPAATGPAALLYYVDGAGHGLADEVAITARAEDMDSPIFAAPVEAVDVSQLPGGAALIGSTAGELTRLADRRVVVIDAAGAASRSAALASPIVGSAGPFDAGPGAREFVFQSAYVWLQAFYARTDALMHGRWDSLLPFFGEDGVVAPGEFSPRLLAALDTGASLCGDAGGYCLTSAWAGAEGEPAEALRHPEEVGPYEMVGALYLRGLAPSASLLPHEFGHFVDLFVGPGLFYEPYACANCFGGSCDPGTTDESMPLTETFADLIAMWLFSEQFADAGQSSACETLIGLSLGHNRSPHNAACRPTGAAISRFVTNDAPGCLPEDNFPDLCDRPGPADFEPLDTIGLCSRRAGYEVDSWHQAFWELLHAESCSKDPPYTCEPLSALAGLPASQAVGEALLFAAQASAGTYDGFCDDFVTYIACQYGQATYDEVNAVLCHHEIRGCDLPAPAVCDLCGDGVRTGAEACDGGDLGGATCESLGLGAGALACDAACAFEVAGCVPLDPETAGEPTTSGAGSSSGAVETGEESPTGGGGASGPGPGGLFIDPGQVADEVGCGCRSDGGGAPLLGGLTLVRRRRRRR